MRDKKTKQITTKYMLYRVLLGVYMKKYKQGI